MPKLATREDRIGIPQINTSGPYAVFDASAIGEGAAALGRGISSLGASLSQAGQRGTSGSLADLNAERAYLQFQHEQDRKADDFFQTLTPENIEGASQLWEQQYDADARAWAERNLKGLDEKNKAEYDQRLLQQRNSRFNSAKEIELKQADRFARLQFTNIVEEELLPQYVDWAKMPPNDPNREKVVQELDRQLAVALSKVPGLSELDRQALYEERLTTLHNGAALSLPDSEQAKLDQVTTPAGDVTSAVGSGDAKPLLRQFEGLILSPKYDVNHYRIGYGSDTVTLSDGSVLSTRQGMQITKDDAERDLDRRIKIYEQKAMLSVGGQKNWSRLPGNVRAALISIAYNYGRLPARVAAAAMGGDIEMIAQAVESLKPHNNGVNANRRQKEANIIRGDLGGLTGSAGGTATWSATRQMLPGLNNEQTFSIAAAARGRLNQRAAGYKNDFNNIIAALEGGIDPSVLPSIDEIIRPLKPDEQAESADQLVTAMATNAVVRGIEMGSPEDDAEALDLANRLESDWKNYKHNSQIADNLRTAVKNKRDELDNDPADYVMQRDENVHRLLSEWRNSEDIEDSAAAAKAFAGAMLDAQARMGVIDRNRRILPKSMTASIANSIKLDDQSQSVVDQIDILAETWGEFWPQILKDISGDLSGDMRVIAAMPPSLSREMLGASIGMSEEDLNAGLTSDDLKDIDDKITMAMEDGLFSSTLEMGATDKERGQILGDYAGAIEKIARIRMQRGENASTAVNQAYADAIGSSYVMMRPMGQDQSIRVPVSANPTSFPNAGVIGMTRHGIAPYVTRYPIIYNAEKIKTNIGAWNVDLPESLIGLNEADTRERYIDSLISNGVWVTSPNEDGLSLVDATGNYVKTSGEVFVVPWAALEAETYNTAAVSSAADDAANAVTSPKSTGEGQRVFDSVAGEFTDMLKKDGAIPTRKQVLDAYNKLKDYAKEFSADGVKLPDFEFFYKTLIDNLDVLRGTTGGTMSRLLKGLISSPIQREVTPGNKASERYPMTDEGRKLLEQNKRSYEENR